MHVIVNSAREIKHKYKQILIAYANKFKDLAARGLRNNH